MQDFGEKLHSEEKETPPHVQRMLEEYDQLKERCDKLAAFINVQSPLFEKLEDLDKQLLRQQLDQMVAYKNTLTYRIERALGGK